MPSVWVGFEPTIIASSMLFAPSVHRTVAQVRMRRGLTLVLRKQPNNKVNTSLASNLDICNLASLYLVLSDQILHLKNTGFTRLSAPDRYQTNERLVLPAERVFGLVSCTEL